MITSFLRRRIAPLLAPLALVAIAVTPVFAGPPLICHPYAIGDAKSLPSGSGKYETSPTYDRTHLVADTLALLTPETPILVRMETLRRAAIYAAGTLRIWNGEKYTNLDHQLTAQMVAALRERTTSLPEAVRPHALFDLGFFAETVRQLELDPALDGYALIQKAAASLPADPAVEFALALASVRPQRAEHAAHLAKARAAAKPGTLIAANLNTHFGNR
jgi:hypothetical protein